LLWARRIWWTTTLDVVFRRGTTARGKERIARSIIMIARVPFVRNLTAAGSPLALVQQLPRRQ
jgi:hypothetical protein